LFLRFQKSETSKQNKPLQSKKTVGGVKTAVGIVSHPSNPLVFKNISLGRDKK
jgi:hypothetical protein